jgi:phage host-nuclease inhibitor protein Gam
MLTLADWTEVDGAVERIGLLDLEIAELTSALGRRLYALVGEYSGRLCELAGQRRRTESAVQAFCTANRDDFAKKRSRQCRYGRIAFRMAERIEIAEELQDAAITTLKKLGFTDCVETRERLDKGALKKLADVDLARCGIKRVREDHFRIEPDMKSIAEKIERSDLAFPEFAVDLEKLSKLIVKRKENDRGAGGDTDPC